MEPYIPRSSDKQIERALSLFGGVLVEGPRWCGKTTSARQFSKSEICLGDSRKKAEIEMVARTKPSLLLKGCNPRLIDEWQEVPRVWDSARMDIDRRSEVGLYILTGSVAFDLTKVMHSGIGRFVKVRMRTLSLFESGLSTGEVRLADLFDGCDVEGVSSVDLEQMAEIIVRGGWPECSGKTLADACRVVGSYCRTIAASNRLGDTVVDGRITQQLLESLSRSIATTASDTDLIEDIRFNDGNPMHINTLRRYESALRDRFIVDDLKAWRPKMRSKAVPRASEKRYLCDPSLAACFLGTTSEGLVDDLGAYGRLFESLAVRDLRVYAEALGGEVRHYHDSYGLEADTVIRLDDGRWGAIVIELGAGYLEDAVKNLKKLAERVDTDIAGKPSFLAVVTCTPYAYRREDGVYVVPIACLRD